MCKEINGNGQKCHLRWPFGKNRPIITKETVKNVPNTHILIADLVNLPSPRAERHSQSYVSRFNERATVNGSFSAGFQPVAYVDQIKMRQFIAADLRAYRRERGVDDSLPFITGFANNGNGRIGRIAIQQTRQEILDFHFVCEKHEHGR